MRVIANSVDEALYEWMYKFRIGKLVREHTRNGPALRISDVCITEFIPGFNRASLCPVRDANPFFHFFEAMWILAARDDVEFLAQFNSRMREFSDNGKTLAGSYGTRYGAHLLEVVRLLRKEPYTRQAVLAGDVNWDSKDVPCNFAIQFLQTNDALELNVFNRSNDLIWGLCGANAVHFSYIHEFVACAVGVPRGIQRHISTNLHLYLELPGQKGLEMLKNPPVPPTPVAGYHISYRICNQSDAGFVRAELQIWLNDMDKRPGSEFLAGVAYPAWQLWKAYKERSAGMTELKVMADCITDAHWRQAMIEWVIRRLKV
jgi:hypothetical protein